DRRTGTGGTNNRDEARFSLTKLVLFVFSRAVQGKEFLFNSVGFAWLNAENEFAVDKSLAAFIQQQRIDSISQRITHAGSDEHVLVAIRVKIAYANAPRPVSFSTDTVRNLAERTATLILIKGIAENAVRSAREVGGRPFN